MEYTSTIPRYSTFEVASMLLCSNLQVRNVMLVHKVRFTKAGNSYLWDAGDVDRIVEFVNGNKGE